MIKKLFIIPWFGPFPEWMDKYRENIEHLAQFGYDFYITSDLEDFNNRVEKTFGFRTEVQPETSLSHNYRTAFGLLYADILEGYDYWGITDLDCVYGNPEDFVESSALDLYDIWSNHHNYICGPWTLFRNTKLVNTLCLRVENWEYLMRNTHLPPGRWTEDSYSQKVDREHEEGVIQRLYTHFQGKDPNIYQHLSYKDEMLYDGTDEIMMFHFNRNKIWPL